MSEQRPLDARHRRDRPTRWLKPLDRPPSGAGKPSAVEAECRKKDRSYLMCFIDHRSWPETLKTNIEKKARLLNGLQTVAIHGIRGDRHGRVAVASQFCKIVNFMSMSYLSFSPHTSLCCIRALVSSGLSSAAPANDGLESDHLRPSSRRRHGSDKGTPSSLDCRNPNPAHLVASDRGAGISIEMLDRFDIFCDI